MQRTWIMVVSADLWRSNKMPFIVRVGPETKRVCEEAGMLFEEISDDNPMVVADAGWSRKYGENMGRLMRDYLYHLGVPRERMPTVSATKSNTQGEMAAFTELLRKTRTDPEDTDIVHLIVRAWHWPRARLLLRANMEMWQRSQTIVHSHRVWSYDWHMIGEPLAFIKNIPNLFRFYALFSDCKKCQGKSSVKWILGQPGVAYPAPEPDAWECHRCGHIIHL